MIFAVFALFTGLAGAQNAVPNFPVGLQGTVSINGNPAPPDTEIIAKVGDTVVGKTKVQSAGTYGDKPNNKLPVTADDGATVDIYVNGVKVNTFTYRLTDAGQTFQANLNAPASGAPLPTATAATAKSISGGGGDNGGGSGTGDKGTLTTTSTQPPAPSEESLQGTKETQVNAPGVPPKSGFKFYAELGIFALAIVCVTLGLILRKRAKLKR